MGKGVSSVFFGQEGKCPEMGLGLFRKFCVLRLAVFPAAELATGSIAYGGRDLEVGN